MPSSYNGWPASPDRAALNITPLVIAGEPFAPGVRGGDVHTVLGYVAQQVHNRVESVSAGHSADDWGYAYRANTNNPSQLSCHASGTAIDYNATQHPNGRGGTWSASEKAEILRILAEVNNVVRVLWGYDEMHFEICGNMAQVAAAAAKVRGQGAVTPAPSAPNGDIKFEARVEAKLGERVLSLGKVGPDVEFVQRWHGLNVDGEFGRLTEQAVRATQARNKLTVDGVVGPDTWAVLGIRKEVPKAVPVKVGRPVLEKGDRGQAVWDLQRKLTTSYSLYSKWKPTGYFGTSTEASVKEFQRRSGLVPDGVVGDKTWKALGL